METQFRPDAKRLKLFEVSDFKGGSSKSWEDQEKTLVELSELIETLGFSAGFSRIRSYQNVLSTLRTKTKQNDVLELSDALRFLHTSVELRQLDTILRAAKATSNLTSWRNHIEKLISGTHPEIPTKLSISWDFQYEALLAAVAQLSGYQIEFQEPDIVVSDGNTAFGIAAKRPRTETGFKRNLRKAAKQILASGHDGIIALDCSVILGTNRAITTTDGAYAADFVTNILAHFLQKNASEIDRVRSEKNIFAVLLTLEMPATIVDSEGKSAVQVTTAFRWTIVPLVGASDPRYKIAIHFAENCQQGLFSNYPSLSAK